MSEIKLPSGRTLAGYDLCSGRAISDGSTAQMMNFVDDAKKDIAHLAALISSADKHRALIETLTAALVDCEDYFDNRADADCDQDGFIPNDEMRLLQPVRRALAAAKQEGF